jgi:hypothetical protein
MKKDKENYLNITDCVKLIIVIFEVVLKILDLAGLIN